MPWPTYATQEEVPEAFRSEYEEREGKWVPKLPDVAGAQTALEKERQRAAEQERLRKEAEDKLAKRVREDKAKTSGITDEQLQQLQREDEEKRRPLEQKITALEAENRKLKLTDRVRALALKHGVLADRIDDAMVLLNSRTDLTDGGDTIVVKDAVGKVTTEKVDDFLATTFKTEKPWLYQGNGASGSGASGSNGSGGSRTTQQPDPAAQNARQSELRDAVAGAL